jgi:hypothetical protein
LLCAAAASAGGRLKIRMSADVAASRAVPGRILGTDSPRRGARVPATEVAGYFHPPLRGWYWRVVTPRPPPRAKQRVAPGARGPHGAFVRGAREPGARCGNESKSQCAISAHALVSWPPCGATSDIRISADVAANRAVLARSFGHWPFAPRALVADTAKAVPFHGSWKSSDTNVSP